jgi:hypothetical protein
MAIQVLSGATNTIWTIDTTSTAGRVTLYDQYGNPMSDINSLANVLNALNSAVTIVLGGQATLGINVSGTTGTLTLAFEATIDNSTWFAISGTPVAGGSTITSTSANGQWIASTSGYYAVRTRVSAFTSGSMTVSVVVTPGQSKTGAQTIATAGALSVEITDASSDGPAAVKGASTAAGAADPALVTALSPNTPLPSGTNALGSVTANRTADSSFATQNITAQDTSSTTAAGANGATYITGSPTAGSAAVFALSTEQSIVVQATGTWTGTLTLECSIDGGTTWFTHGIKQNGASYIASSFTANFIGGENVTGATHFRARATAAWTGTATILVRESVNLENVYVSNPLTLRDNTTQSIANTIKAASTAAATTDTALVVAVSPNNTPILPSNAATASNQTTLGTQTTEINDGTHTATIKAASTAAVATDTALVVAVSPNNIIQVVSYDADPVTQNITAQDVGSTSTAGANGQNLITGSSTAGSTASFTYSSYETIKIQVTGTWTGTISSEISLDGGTTWSATDLHQTGTAYTMNTFTGNFIGGVNVSGTTNFRIRATAAWTGTATVKLVESGQTNTVYVTNAQSVRDGVTQSTLNTIKPASTAAVATDTSFVVALSPNSPNPPVSDLTGTGTISALNGSVVWGTQGMSGQGIQIQGTWSGTIAFQFSIDGGTTWWADEVQSAQGSSGIVESTTANGMWFSTGLGGYRQYRLFATAWSSGTANITWDAGVGNNALSTVTNIVDGVGNGPAAVALGSTAAVASQQALVVGLSPNSPLYDGFGNPMPVKNRVEISTTQGVTPVSGLDVGLMNRSMRVGEIGTARTTSEIQLWQDAFEGSTINAFWTQSLTTMTAVQATGVLTLNNSAITTLNTDAIITSQRQFPKYPKVSLHARYKANISANVASNHTFVEFGFGAPSGVTAIISNGCFFRVTSAGNLVGVVSYNGTETASATLLAQGSISTTSYYRWDIFVEDQFARFIVTDSNDIPVVDAQLQIPLTDPVIWAVSHLPTFARVYTDTTGGGTAVQLKLASHNVQTLDASLNMTWEEQSALSMRNANITPTTYAQTASSMTAVPATLTPANASAGYATLGGEYAFATTVAFETGASIFGYQIPTPYTFVLESIFIPPPIVATTIAVTLVPYVEWLLVVNGTSNILSTAGGFRQPLGITHSALSASAIQGAVWGGGGSNLFTPKTPIICLPGTWLHIGFKLLGPSAAATPGLHRGTVTVDGHFI